MFFILIDEIYLKAGLVYNKSTGSLTGFADLGVVQKLSKYDESLSSDSNARPLAKTMMVFMVQGVFCNLRFLYVQFQTQAHDVFPLLWQAIDRLELKTYMSLVSLKMEHLSTANFFKCMVQHLEPTNAPTFIAMRKGTSIFFSDPPHLLKTIRNALASKSRNLWVSVFIGYILFDS